MGEFPAPRVSVYCGYANGVFAREFVDYGNARGYHRELPLLRAKLKGGRSAEQA